jgi:Immunity protein 74
MKVEILGKRLRVTSGARSLPVEFAPSGEGGGTTRIVSLDAIETWDPPGEGPEVTLEDLQKISAAIELACEKAGLDVEFE